jgi:signal transduction histidine kinase
LQTEVARLNGELERANSELGKSLEENSRVRSFLARILEGLPCGVLVVDAAARLRVINPEARRLLMLDPSWVPEQGVALPAVIDRLLAESSSKAPAAEREWSFDDPAGTRFLGITQARVAAKNGQREETIWILRDMTQEKRLFAEREKSRRNESLAEIATVLAHEIRNPLGSLELFAGLLADSTAVTAESGQWVGQIQAGPAMEDELTRSIEGPAAPDRLAAPPATPLLRRVLDGLQRLVGDPAAVSSTILLCHSPARFRLRRLLEPFLPRVVVLAPAEIPPGVTVESLGVIR